MCEGKPHVEERISPMDDLVVHQHESILVNENVLRTEVTMNQGSIAHPRIGGEPTKERADFGDLCRREFVEGLESKGFEERSVPEISR